MAKRAKQAKAKTEAATGGGFRSWLRVGLASVLMVAVLGGIGWGAQRLMDADTLPVRHVTVQGTLRHVDRDALRAAVQPAVAKGFFGFDVARVRAAAQSLPWVRQASVRRVWPDTVAIRIAEHRAVARWGGDAAVSRRGVVFDPRPGTLPDALPGLSGPEGHAAQVVQRYRSFASELAATGLRITALHQDRRRAWQITLAQGFRLRLGRRRVEQRLARFAAVYREHLAPRVETIERVDLRYTNGFAVAWRAAKASDSSS